MKHFLLNIAFVSLALTAFACYEEGGESTPVEGEACDPATFEDICTGNYRVFCNDQHVVAVENCHYWGNAYSCRKFPQSELDDFLPTNNRNDKAFCSMGCAARGENDVIDRCASTGTLRVDHCVNNVNLQPSTVSTVGVASYNASTNAVSKCENAILENKTCHWGVEYVNQVPQCKTSGFDKGGNAPTPGSECGSDFKWACINNRSFVCDASTHKISMSDCEANGRYCVYDFNGNHYMECVSTCDAKTTKPEFMCTRDNKTGSAVMLVRECEHVQEYDKDLRVITGESIDHCDAANKRLVYTCELGANGNTVTSFECPNGQTCQELSKDEDGTIHYGCK